MITFQVDDMTCGGCARSITRAVQAADAGATVQVDLAAHRVQVEPQALDAQAVQAAIQKAGFTPVPLPAN